MNRIYSLRYSAVAGALLPYLSLLGNVFISLSDVCVSRFYY